MSANANEIGPTRGGGLAESKGGKYYCSGSQASYKVERIVCPP
jgi:hypothetical protein